MAYTTMDPLTEYAWIMVFGVITAFFCSCGIGANDVANSFATSVGSKALTLKQACGLAVIFEFLGAVLAGSNVAETIRKGIADTNCYTGSYMDAAILMYGNLCVIGAVGIWLLLASYLEMPVSTTHSTCGGLVGMAIVTKGSGCVIWYKKSGADKLYIPGGILGIVLSWIISPVVSGIIAALIFGIVRTVVLRSSNSYSRAIKTYPVLIWFAVWINCFFVLSKGISKKICPKGYKIWICHGTGGHVDGWIAFAFACGFGLLIALLFLPVLGVMRRKIDEEFSDEGIAAAAAKAKSQQAAKEEREATVDETTGMAKTCANVKNTCLYSLNKNIHEVVEGDAATETLKALYANAEKFDPKTEAVFRYVQIFTAICVSFAHGANDVANAIGPFMAIFAAYRDGVIVSKPNLGDDAYWILALGGAGIGIGVSLYGYKIMRAIGVKLAVITPARGFSMELSTATVIVIGSYIGLPLSTTHCQVGSTTGVGLLEGAKGVNKWILLKTAVGWIITLIIAGISAGLIVAQGVQAPLAGSIDSPNTPQAIFLQHSCGEYIAMQKPLNYQYVNETIFPTVAFCNSSAL